MNKRDSVSSSTSDYVPIGHSNSQSHSLSRAPMKPQDATSFRDDDATPLQSHEGSETNLERYVRFRKEGARPRRVLGRGLKLVLLAFFAFSWLVLAGVYLAGSRDEAQGHGMTSNAAAVEVPGPQVQQPPQAAVIQNADGQPSSAVLQSSKKQQGNEAEASGRNPNMDPRHRETTKTDQDQGKTQESKAEEEDDDDDGDDDEDEEEEEEEEDAREEKDASDDDETDDHKDHDAVESKTKKKKKKKVTSKGKAQSKAKKKTSKAKPEPKSDIAGHHSNTKPSKADRKASRRAKKPIADSAAASSGTSPTSGGTGTTGTSNPFTITSPAKRKNIWDRTAIMLKTGTLDMCLERVPSVLSTTLRHIHNLIMVVPYEESSCHFPFIHTFAAIDWYAEARPDFYQYIFTQDAGWRRDAFKFMPGLLEIHSVFPDKDWYIMVDDDSYVFYNNLAPILERMDPTEKVFFGEKFFWETTEGCRINPFVHGGGGIILSRAAVEAILPIMFECSERYKQCAGDVILASCLADVDIFMYDDAPFGLFHRDPPGFVDPNDYGGWFGHPCDKMISYHHLNTYLVKLLWEMEHQFKGEINLANLWWGLEVERHISAREGDDHVDVSAVQPPLTQFEKLLPKHIHKTLRLVNVDLPGWDISLVTGGGEESCRRSCFENPECLAWTFWEGDRRCFLKDRWPTQIRGEGVISGLMPERMQCME